MVDIIDKKYSAIIKHWFCYGCSLKFDRFARVLKTVVADRLLGC